MNVADVEDDQFECPKRVWILTALSDDEHCGEAGGRSPAMQAHLAQCTPCRDLADRLERTTSMLAEAACELPADSLAAAAELQALGAIRAGATPTGRVQVPEVELPACHFGRGAWRRYARYAAAAVIILSVGLIKYAEWRTYDNSPVARRAVGPVRDRHGPVHLTLPSHGDGGGLAAGDPEGGASAGPELCIHDNLIDAANCERDHVIHPVTVLGRPAKRAARSGAEPTTGMAIAHPDAP